MMPALLIRQGAVGMGGPSEMFPVEARSLGLCTLVINQYQRSDITWGKTGFSLGRDTAPSSWGVSG